MNLSQFSLEGKVALITGGSRGIGRASALALADAGASVVVSSRKIADLEPVAEEIKAKGVKSMAIAAHNAKTEDSKTLIEQVMKAFGKIDILMNNAGTNPYYGPLMDQDEKTYDITMNVNLKGLFFLSQLAARIMKAQGGGCIINTASIGGLRAGELGVYSVIRPPSSCSLKLWPRSGDSTISESMLLHRGSSRHVSARLCGKTRRLMRKRLLRFP
jgi:dehydrogenase/reductase SDR family member 4